MPFDCNGTPPRSRVSIRHVIRLRADISTLPDIPLDARRGRQRGHKINVARSALTLGEILRKRPAVDIAAARDRAAAAPALSAALFFDLRVVRGAQRAQIVEASGSRVQRYCGTAGVAPSPILSTLGVTTDHAGRVCIGPFLEIPDKPGIFVVGDAAAATQGGRPLPGVAQVAIQQGRYVGGFIAALLNGRPKPHPFWYSDRGNMAVVGRNFAILESGRIRLGGFIALWIWAFVHLMSLPQMQNRGRVLTQWLWAYLAGQRGARLIPEAPIGG